MILAALSQACRLCVDSVWGGCLGAVIRTVIHFRGNVMTLEQVEGYSEGKEHKALLCLTAWSP